MVDQELIGTEQMEIRTEPRPGTRWRAWLERLRRQSPAAPAQSLPVELQRGSPLLEACRTLRINLVPGQIDQSPPPLLIAGNGADRGCALVAAGLAIVLAEEDRSTLLVDASLRQPILHHLFSARPGPGLSEALEAVGPVAPVQLTSRLALLPAGVSQCDAATLFGMPSVAAVTRALAERFDAVVYLAPHLWTNADVLFLAPHVGSAVLAIRAGVDSAEEMKRFKDALERAGVRLLGFTFLDRPR